MKSYRLTTERVAAIVKEMRWRAESIGCTGECDDGTCCEPDNDMHPEDWCNHCLMGALAQHMEAEHGED